MDKPKFSGEITILKKSHKFVFDGKQLKVELYDEDEAHELLYDKCSNGIYSFSGRKQLPSETISGVIKPCNKKIVFIIHTKNYYINNNSIFSSQGTDIYINVYRYIICEYSPINNNKTTIIYNSSHFHHFLSLIPIYKINDNDDDNVLAEIEVKNKNSLKQKSTFSINGLEYCIQPGYHYECGIGVFKFDPYLVLETNAKLDINEIWKIYDTLCNVIKFLFLRSNIYPDSFVVNSGEKKYSIYEREWDIVKEKEEELNQSFVFNSARWFRIYKNFGNIFEYFYLGKGEHILGSLYNNIEERFVYSKPLVSSDAAAFEHIFDELFIDYTNHSDEGNRIREVIKKEIEKLMEDSSGNKKKKYKEIIRGLKHVPFKDKLFHALNKYEKVLKEINREYNRDFNIKEISEKCSEYRNSIDHGNDGVIMDDDSVQKLTYMRMITFVLYYHLFEVSGDDISGIIRDLFFR